MAPIVLTLETACPVDEAFSYVTDPTRFAEWQRNTVRADVVGGGPHGVNSRYTSTRRIGPVERTMTSEITEFNPPRRWAVRGLGGPIREIIKVAVDPLDGDERSRVTIEIDFEGHGIGKLLVPLVVRRQARKETPANRRRLRERLESGGSAPPGGPPS